MKIILRGALLLIAFPVIAQTPSTTIKISLDPASADATDTRESDAFRRVLSQDLHYTLVNDSHYDVSVSTACKQRSDNSYDCSYVFIYQPDKYLGMSKVLNSGLAHGATDEGVAKQIMSGLIANTTPDVIGEADHLLNLTRKNLISAAGATTQR